MNTPTITGTALSGVDGNGVVEFPGAVTSITFTVPTRRPATSRDSRWESGPATDVEQCRSLGVGGVEHLGHEVHEGELLAEVRSAFHLDVNEGGAHQHVAHEPLRHV